jgi:hypothetical protein
MKPQNLKNNIRFYTPHHFVYYPVLIAFLVSSVYFTFTTENHLIWAFISVVLVFYFVLLLCYASIMP